MWRGIRTLDRLPQLRRWDGLSLNAAGLVAANRRVINYFRLAGAGRRMGTLWPGTKVPAAVLPGSLCALAVSKRNMAPTHRSGVRLITLAQVAGVIFSGWLVWLYTVLPPTERQSLASLFAEASFYVLLAWSCGAAIIFCVYLVVSLADPPEVIRLSVRSSAPAMWFAPAFILLSAPVPAAAAVSLVLIVNASRMLVSHWVALEPPVASPRLRWASVLMCSLAAQAGAVSMLWRAPLPAAAFLAASAAMLTSLAFVSGAYRPDRHPVCRRPC